MQAADGLQDAENDSDSYEEVASDDEAFHQQFIRELRQKDQLEVIKSSRGVNFEEDDDKFIIDLNKDERVDKETKKDPTKQQ